MDLFAYAQIADLEEVMANNNIEIPRLRGLRLMSEENMISEEAIKSAIESQHAYIFEQFCTSVPRFDPFSNMHEWSWRTDKIRKKFLIKQTVEDTDFKGNPRTREKVVGIRWDLIHGKARKKLKLALKRGDKEVVKNLQTFNKYVGRPDVLYIHARIGGNNWEHWGGPELSKQPWFLEKVDDYFDHTYCDIYAKIDV